MAERLLVTPIPMSDPDAALLQAIAVGETSAFQELYTRHGLPLLNYLLRELGERPLAEEVLQEVMLAVWQQAGQFRWESRVSTWMFAIARRQALKARQRRRYHAPLEAEQIAHDTLTSEQILEVESLQQAIGQLPADQQEALELVFYRGLSGAEAAQQVGIPLNTLKSRLQRARHNLLRLLGQEDHHE